MSTVTAYIRTIKTNKNKFVNVRFRLRDGRDFQVFHKSEISILPNQWDDKQQKIKARVLIDEEQRRNTDKAVTDRKNLISEIYQQKGKNLTSDKLEIEIDKILNPEKYETPELSFFDFFNEFLGKHKLSDARKKHYFVVYRALQRFEVFTQKTVKNKKSFQLNINTVDVDTLTAFDDFLRKEYIYYVQYPEIYALFPDKHTNEQRGTNTIAGILSKLRTFFNWCNYNELTTNKPFTKYKISSELYGTPFYLTIDERNELYHFDLSNRPELEKQRDIFVFQCVIGCRVGDLYTFTKENVINGTLHYVAGKTKDKEPKTLKVPLNSIATEIINKYSNLDGSQLLPLISKQKYNDAIKTCFSVAGLNRKVTVLNPLTRQSEIKPLNEIASSHLARRTFCGNLYKKVKDPNLVGSLSGHAEGSKAFARYRDIDEEMKKELVSMIE